MCTRDHFAVTSHRQQCPLRCLYFYLWAPRDYLYWQICPKRERQTSKHLLKYLNPSLWYFPLQLGSQDCIFSWWRAYTDPIKYVCLQLCFTWDVQVTVILWVPEEQYSAYTFNFHPICSDRKLKPLVPQCRKGYRIRQNNAKRHRLQLLMKYWTPNYSRNAA